MPAYDLLDQRLDVGQRAPIGDEWETVSSNNLVDLCLSFPLSVRVEGHGYEEYKGRAKCLGQRLARQQ